MTPVALKYIGRGRTDRALTMVDILSATFIRLWRLVHDPARRDAGGSHWLHPERDLTPIRLVPRFGASIVRVAALDAVMQLMDEVHQMHPAIERLGVLIPVEAVQEIERFRQDVEQKVSH